MSLTGLSFQFNQRWQALGSHQMILAAKVYQVLGMCQALCAFHILAHVMLLQEVDTIPGPLSI